jgi:hypothetical protein
MPNYEPDRWNATKVRQQANNCYSYATNNMKDPPADSPPPERVPEPGKKSNKRIRRFIEQIRADVDGNVQQLSIIQIACHTADHAGQPNNPDPAGNTESDVQAEYQRPLVGVCEAVLADGLHEEGHCATNANCWRVAVFVRPQRLNPPRPPMADFHFVREDTLPDGTKKWSHKPGPEPVTDQKYNPSTEKWDGGPIADPRALGRHQQSAGWRSAEEIASLSKQGEEREFLIHRFIVVPALAGAMVLPLGCTTKPQRGLSRLHARTGLHG